MRRLTLWIGTAGILASGLLSAPVQAAQAPTGLTPLEDEAAVRVFESSAQTKAALGFYTDATTGDLVALLGADAAGASPRTFTTTEGLRVRIEVDSQITSDDVEAVKERLGSLRQDKARFPSANIQFWFDPSKRRVVAQGTPEDIVKVKRSYTAQFLKPVLERREAPRGKKRVEAAE